MSDVKLLPYQQEILNEIKDRKKCAIYTGCGTGKTFMGSEKLVSFPADRHLIICQKSMVRYWKEHMKRYYDIDCVLMPKKTDKFQLGYTIVTFGLVANRFDLYHTPCAVLIDESSKLQAKTTVMWKKGISKLTITHLVLLSGTPVTGSHVERMWTQLNMLGCKLTYKEYLDRFIDYEIAERYGTNIKYYQYNGAKNLPDLMRFCHMMGCVFRRTEDLIDLPEENDINHLVPCTLTYRTFAKTRIIKLPFRHDYSNTSQPIILKGDTALNQMLGARIIAATAREKLEMFGDIIDGIDGRVVVFYNFDRELEMMKSMAPILSKERRHISYINGSSKDQSEFQNNYRGLIFVQYQSGSYGLNLQQANQVIFISPPLSCELLTQAKGRIRRLGQEKKCFYHYLIMENSVEEQIYDNLEKGIDYNEQLFTVDYENGVV